MGSLDKYEGPSLDRYVVHGGIEDIEGGFPNRGIVVSRPSATLKCKDSSDLRSFVSHTYVTRVSVVIKGFLVSYIGLVLTFVNDAW